jgi:hypothetical protein
MIDRQALLEINRKIATMGGGDYHLGKHSLAHGLEEWDKENIFSHQISFQCLVFCVTL